MLRSAKGIHPVRKSRAILLVTFAIIALHPLMGIAQEAAKPAAVAEGDKPFDPHDLSGVWRLPMIPRTNLLFRSPMPEPPLTPWGKTHLFPGGITHGSNITVSGGFPGQNCDPISA